MVSGGGTFFSLARPPARVMPTARVRGLDLHYLEAGEPGRPLVLLLHGSLGSADQWGPHLEALARAGWRALALDDRGHGASTPFGAPGNPWEALSVPPRE